MQKIPSNNYSGSRLRDKVAEAVAWGTTSFTGWGVVVALEDFCNKHKKRITSLVIRQAFRSGRPACSCEIWMWDHDYDGYNDGHSDSIVNLHGRANGYGTTMALAVGRAIVQAHQIFEADRKRKGVDNV